MGNSPIVSRINALLAEKGISKQDFYRNCGITSATYSLWNTGKTNPRQKNLETIAEYLNTTTDYLLTGLGTKEKISAINDRDFSENPDIRLIARAGKKMSHQDAEKLRRIAELMFPEAFK